MKNLICTHCGSLHIIRLSNKKLMCEHCGSHRVVKKQVKKSFKDK